MMNILRNIKPIIGIMAIAVVVIILVLILLFSNEDSINDIKVYTGSGPKVNLQSIATGNTMAVPEVGNTAVYGIYVNNIKVGEITYRTEKQEIYQGIECYKIIGSGSMSYTEMDFSYEYFSYISKFDNILVYSEYIYHYKKPFEQDMNMTTRVDKQTGEIITSMMDHETVLKMPEAFWELSELQNNLYVGLGKEFTYKISEIGTETLVSVKITIIKKEDVIVPAGLFEDCFKVQTETNRSGYTSITSIWVNDEGVAPKSEVAMSKEGPIIQVTQLLSYS